MSDRNNPGTGVTKVGGTDLSWLEKHQLGEHVNASLDDYKILPRIKTIQGMSAQKLQDAYGVGSLILSPGDAIVAKKGVPFHFTPVFFFPEFLKCGDREDTNTPFIVARTFDPTHEIARRCQNAETRTEGYGERNQKGDYQYHYTYVETLNFPGFVVDETHDLRGVPVVLVFAKGEWSRGRNLAQAISLRRANGKKVPMHLQRWKMCSALREKGTRRWWGIDFENPEQPYINQDMVEFMSTQAKELSEFFAKQKLRVAGDPEDEAAEGGTQSTDL